MDRQEKQKQLVEILHNLSGYEKDIIDTELSVYSDDDFFVIYQAVMKGEIEKLLVDKTNNDDIKESLEHLPKLARTIQDELSKDAGFSQKEITDVISKLINLVKSGKLTIKKQKY